MKDRISPLYRHKRPVGKDGNNRDTAFCYITQDGVRTPFECGRWGSADADARYRQLCAEFYTGSVSVNVADESESITIAVLCAKFLKHKIDKNVDDRDGCKYKIVIKLMLKVYPELPTAKFNATAFRHVRQQFIEYGKSPKQWVVNKSEEGGYYRTLPPWSRSYVNTLAKQVREIFHWGVSWDLAPPEVIQKIDSVPGLRRDDVPDYIDETDPVTAVPDEVVIATLPYMPPMIADMVKIQRAACMRPSELCNLKVQDVINAGIIGTVTTEKHKTARFGVLRHIAFSAHEIEILKRRSVGKKPDEFIFSPKESEKERLEILRASRKTKVQPSQVNRAKDNFNRFNDYYKVTSYYRAIVRAQEKARKAGVSIPNWFPYQMRHAAVTETSLRHGREIASLQAGHLNIKTTEIYDHKTAEVAAQLADERSKEPAWWDKKKPD